MSDSYVRASAIFHAALERPVSERAEFVREAAHGDDDLRREVESLLGYAAEPAPLLDIATGRRPGTLIGRRIGTFEVRARIGAGGMGEVYRAHDHSLGRDVALKFLPDGFARDPDRLARFDREARALAALNHPNIAQVYGLAASDDLRAIAMEFVEGRTLEDVMYGGGRRTARLSMTETLTIARQLADALEAAHEAGIIHRDFKPANVVLREDGTVKVLDFGLAKALGPDGTSATADTGSGDSTTLLSPDVLSPVMTQDGVILGTAGYMAPEQAQGKTLDRRADVWAFGVVLYEMLTGRRAYEGEHVRDVLSQVMTAAPPLAALPAATPEALRRLLRRCLEINRRQRLADMGAARLDVEDAIAGEPASQAPGPRRTWLRWAAPAGVVVIGLAGALAYWLGSGGLSTPVNQAGREVTVQRLTDLVGLEEAPALSPDGKAVAFVASVDGHRQIWVRLIASGAQVRLTTNNTDHFGPRWSSPDALIYYTQGAQAGDQGTIWETPSLPGSARRLATATGPGDVSHDGKSLAFIRFQGGSPELSIAARDGTSVRTVSKLTPGSYFNLRWSPDDRRLAVFRDLGGGGFNSDLLVVDVSGGAPRVLAGGLVMQGGTWAPDGNSLIVSSARGSLMQYPPTFNLWRVPLDGSAQIQMTFGEASYEFPDIGAQGPLVVSRSRAQADVWKFPVTGPAAENVRNGVRITRQTSNLQTLTVSPDESEVAYLSDNGGQANVWIAKVATGAARLLTQEFDPQIFIAVPYWSPRGDWINYLSNRNTKGGVVTLWVAKPDGTDKRDLGVIGAWVCWSGDGRFLYYSTSVNDGPHQIRKVSLEGGAPLTVRDDDAVGCAVTADGSALYYGKIVRQTGGIWDFEVRVAAPETGPSRVLGRLTGNRVPVTSLNYQGYLSPDGGSLAMPLVDGSTTNLWSISTDTGEWRKLTDFGARNVSIARRIGWSRDGRAIYASVADIDSDIVMLKGLK